MSTNLDGRVKLALVIVSVLGLIGAANGIWSHRPRDVPAQTAITSPSLDTRVSADFLSGKRAGHAFGRDWADGAGHPQTSLMPTIARRQWEANGREWNPTKWQDGWITGFDQGFAERKRELSSR